MYAKIINNTTKEVLIGELNEPKFYASLGMKKMEVEQAYDGKWYVKGYAPEKPETLAMLDRVKEELASYDYIGVKIAMGVATKEEYTDQIAYTEELRKKVNTLQALYNSEKGE